MNCVLTKKRQLKLNVNTELDEQEKDLVESASEDDVLNDSKDMFIDESDSDSSLEIQTADVFLGKSRTKKPFNCKVTKRKHKQSPSLKSQKKRKKDNSGNPKMLTKKKSIGES